MSESPHEGSLVHERAARAAQAAADTVASGWVAQGPRVGKFEEAFAAAVGAPAAVVVSSFGAAVQLALIEAGVGPGDTVVIPARVSPIIRAAVPNAVVAAVDPDTDLVTPASVAAVMSDKVKAVVVTHAAGMPADVRAIEQVSGNAVIIEDAEVALGATAYGKPVGADARIAVFSLGPDSPVTTGSGGVITLADPEAAVRLRRLREHGMSVSAAERHSATKVVVEQYLELGYNHRMTDIQAAVGLVQLEDLDAVVEEWRARAAEEREALRSKGFHPADDPPYGRGNGAFVWASDAQGAAT